MQPDTRMEESRLRRISADRGIAVYAKLYAHLPNPYNTGKIGGHCMRAWTPEEYTREGIILWWADTMLLCR